MPMARRITLNTSAMYRYLKREGISRDELARRMNVTNVTAYRVEKGVVDPSPKFIAGLLEVTGMRFEDLFEIVTDAA